MLNLLGANRFEDDSIKTAKELFRLNNSEKELIISRGLWCSPVISSINKLLFFL